MAHFAKIGFNNIVEKVEVVNNDVITQNGIEIEQLGIDFLNNLYGTNDVWVQTSYNKSFRYNFASIGDTYNLDKDAFIPVKPFESWILNTENYQWEAPIPYPNDGKKYFWREYIQQWVERS
jgi:hypothetical protein